MYIYAMMFSARLNSLHVDKVNSENDSRISSYKYYTQFVAISSHTHSVVQMWPDYTCHTWDTCVVKEMPE